MTRQRIPSGGGGFFLAAGHTWRGVRTALGIGFNYYPLSRDFGNILRARKGPRITAISSS